MVAVLDGHVYRILQDNVEQGVLERKASKIHLYFELRRILGEGVDLGFEETSLPDKKWLKNVLFTLDPENTVFVALNAAIVRHVPNGKYLHFTLVCID